MELPGTNPIPYAVFVDEKDIIWLTDLGSNVFVRFDPTKETFTEIKYHVQVHISDRSLGFLVKLGAESGTDKITLTKTGP